MRGNFFHIKRIISLCFLLVFLTGYSVSLANSGEGKRHIPSSKEQKKDGGQEATIEKMSIEAIIPVLKLNLSEIYFSFIEFPSIELTARYIQYKEPLIFSRYFKNLFTCIISVNAP